MKNRKDMTGISTKFDLKQIEADVELERKKQAILVEHTYIHKHRLIPKSIYIELKRTKFCMECGHRFKPTEKPEIHHVQPKRLGGDQNFENLIAICKSCHTRLDAEEENNGKNL